MDRKTTESGEIDEALNPHRGEEQARAREHTADILARRGVLLTAMRTTMSWLISGRRSTGSSRWSSPGVATP